MIPYEELIMQELKGETPKERYDNLIAMKKMLMRIAFPARGSKDEAMSIFQYANEIEKTIGRKKLESA